MCIDPPKGYNTKDGYVRVLDKPRGQGGRLFMRHRVAWEEVHGAIPEGYEIDHMCKNRRCCNVEHLQMLTRSEHRAKDNAERYLPRFLRFKNYYLTKEPKLSQAAIAQDWGVSPTCVWKWIKRIKQEKEKLNADIH